MGVTVVNKVVFQKETVRIALISYTFGFHKSA